ncbi:uncharacterized protein TNCV_3070481 [Trichonephila clavipes]|nr:uncharacterized protein TNCV_3070481 [Trichonephila clavipes]
MPQNTLRLRSEYVLAKSVGPKVLWSVAAEIACAGGWRILPSPQVPCLNCGGGDRKCRHLSCKKSNLSQAVTTFIPSLREGHDDNDNFYPERENYNSLIITKKTFILFIDQC